MGTKVSPSLPETTPVGLADVLFTPVQQRVLGLLFGQPERRFQGAELIRMAGSGTGAVHRFVTRLAESGLVTVERVGNQKHYQANRESPVFVELHGLIRKTSGLLIPIRAALEPVREKIDAAFVYGSVAKGRDRTTSDIDLMVISSSVDYGDLFKSLRTAEGQLGRAVSPTVMTRAEWRRKIKSDSFAARVSQQHRLFVIGTEDDL